MIYSSNDSERDAVLEVAKLMAAAARTAPKTCGVDNIETLVLDGGDKDALADEMRKIGSGPGAAAWGARNPFVSNAENVDDSSAVVLVAVRRNPVGLAVCGLCGFENCGASAKAGALCAFNVSDLGTAACSACAVAARHWIDNRLMYTAGLAAHRLGLFSKEVVMCYGIPVSAKGKSIYFDRK
jgi:uncharacterized ferredoxin-like protein